MNRLGMCLVFLLLSCWLQSPGGYEVMDTSLCGVLANPSAFDGKMIRIKAATVVAGFDVSLTEAESRAWQATFGK